ncbi:MAG TPA: tetratricopeptide repeat protein [Pseudonocardiaceae bacterium]|nr:tetratricopeptide repeat protein [Pseudonocardiaceae bacterium]
MTQHLLITGRHQHDRTAAWQRTAPPGSTFTVNCHARLRGIYTGTNTLMRELVPIVYERAPEIVHAHATEILYLAPELDRVIDPDVFRPIPTEVYTEHQRVLIRAYSTVRPLLLAHGITNFLKKSAEILPFAVYFENAHEADELDRQFLTIATRRINPDLLTIGIGSPTPLLTEFTTRLVVPATQRPASANPARAYVDSDGTTDHAAEIAAYHDTDLVVRQQWHDERAELLEEQDDFGPRLGAIPYHRAHGRFPGTLGAAAYTRATEYVTDVGYYEAAIRIGDLGRALVDRETQFRDYRSLFVEQDVPLLLLRRTEAAHAMYAELRAFTADPMVQAHAAYGLAMLYARFYPLERRDYPKARAWINTALALARTLPQVDLRAHLTAFEQNGLALVEFRLGRFAEAIRVETEAMELLDSRPGPHRYELFLRRALLSFNRAQVYAVLGRWDEAAADLTTVIDLFPQESDGYLERGNAHRNAGRYADALADYHRGIDRNPPAEAHYNRAGLLADLGRLDEALADYDIVLDMDPDHLDTLINRAGLHYDRDDIAAARVDVEHGLSLAPNNAQLLCTLGLIQLAEGDADAANHSLTKAIERDATLVEAWANRAALAYETGDTRAAIADLTEALALSDDATIRCHRATCYRELGQHAEADRDLAAANDVLVAD